MGMNLTRKVIDAKMKNVFTGGTLWILLLMLSAMVSSAAAQAVPNSGKDWVTLAENGLEFQPAELDMSDPRVQAAMGEAKERMLGESSKFYGQMAESDQKYYNAYAQAWRLLGFYIDCSAASDNDGGSNDGNSCMRYLLWAAYVDLDYQGGGFTEYSFYDANKDVWDNSTCTSEARCAKMDCHNEDTHFQLLGVFKEADWDEWFEQLFKHEAYCLWTNNQYYRMSTYRELWPEECTMTLTKDSKGNYLYYDMKPLSGGRIDIGLYKDSRCSQDYTGNIKVDSVLSDMYNDGNNNNNNNNDDSYGDNAYDLHMGIDRWNEAYDVFTRCQPCLAHTPPQQLRYSSQSSNSNWWNWGGGDDDNNDDGAYNYNSNSNDEDSWDCDDDAGYTNVNQCMKFAYKTDMESAIYQDIVLASRQGTITNAHVFGANEGFETEGKTRREMAIFASSSVGLFLGGWYFIRRTLGSVYQIEIQYPLVPGGTIA